MSTHFSAVIKTPVRLWPLDVKINTEVECILPSVILNRGIQNAIRDLRSYVHK